MAQTPAAPEGYVFIKPPSSRTLTTDFAEPEVSTVKIKLIKDPVGCVSHSHACYQFGMSAACLIIGEVPEEIFEGYEKCNKARGTDANAIQKTLLMGLATLATIAKPATSKNTPYVYSRFSSALSSISATNLMSSYKDQPPTGYVNALVSISESHATRPRSAHLMAAAAISAIKNQTRVPGSILYAMMVQVEMVFSYAQLKTAELMHDLLKSGSSLLCIETIASEAVAFYTHWKSFHQFAGEYAKYGRLLSIKGVDNLNNRNYPNLYTAAHMWGQESGRITGNFERSNFPHSVDPKLIEFLVKTTSSATAASDNLAAALADLGIHLPDLETRQSLLDQHHGTNKRPRHANGNSDDEDDSRTRRKRH